VATYFQNSSLLGHYPTQKIKIIIIILLLLLLLLFIENNFKNTLFEVLIMA
jgi:hypothetical protein